MDRGLYSAVSGGLLNSRRLEVVANNLANANTVGFKAQRLAARQQSFEDTLASQLPSLPSRARGDFDRTPGVMNIETVTDFSPGPLEETGNPLHVALRKQNQFFVVATPEGDAYTRAGNLMIDGERNLVTADGFPLLSEGGPITLPQGDIHIAETGVVAVNNEVLGTLRVVEVDDLSSLKRASGARFVQEGNAAPRAVPADLVPGAVEMPNISVVEAMVDLIAAQRSFEAYTKSARTIDEMNELAIRNGRMTG